MKEKNSGTFSHLASEIRHNYIPAECAEDSARYSPSRSQTAVVSAVPSGFPNDVAPKTWRLLCSCDHFCDKLWV
jgi:hypothetical protein